jgi:hypothetical protein
MLNPLITIENWDGGSTLSERVGNKNQNFQGTTIDFDARKGYITCKAGYTRMSLSASTDIGVEIESMLYTGKDANRYFGTAASTGIIYSQTDSGTIASANDSANNSAISSLIEYNGYMYYTQAASIGRSDLAGSPTYTDNWQTTSLAPTCSVISDGTLWFGNGQYVAKWDDTTFTYNALDVQTGWVVKKMDNFGIPYLAVAVNNVTSSGLAAGCKILLWDRTSPTIWNDEIDVPEKYIQNILYAGGYLWIWAGSTANLYVCPLGSRQATRVWTFNNLDPRDYAFTVYPNAVTYHNGRVYFGLSNSPSASSAFTPSGLYSFNPNPTNLQLNIEINGGTLGSFRSIASMYGTASQALYVGYQTGSTQYLLRENLYTSDNPFNASLGSSGYAVYESFYFDAPIGKKLLIDGVGIDFLPISSAGTFTLSYKKDNETSFTTIFSDANTAGTENSPTGKYQTLKIEARTIKFKLSFSGGSGSIRPYFKRIFATGGLTSDTR